MQQRGRPRGVRTNQERLERERRDTGNQPDWVINRNEIEMSDVELGRGAYGRVVKARFRRCEVAVKDLHGLIFSPHNRALFEREVDIASRCRHPCMLQFIGATNDEESPLIVTELMATSLRALLDQQSLDETEVSIISLDVALALNYLHQKSPPIVHRDISSPNILLWRQDNRWRGKVSDYGSVKVLEQIMTVAPGNAAYSAPEAADPNQQTIKVSYHKLSSINVHAISYAMLCGK